MRFLQVQVLLLVALFNIVAVNTNARTKRCEPDMCQGDKSSPEEEPTDPATTTAPTTTPTTPTPTIPTTQKPPAAPPVQFNFTTTLEEKCVVKTSESIKLRVRVKGASAEDLKDLKVKWCKNGQELPPSNRMKFTKIGEDEFECEIQKSEKNDAGYYEVFVTSSKSGKEIKSSTVVSVEDNSVGVGDLKFEKRLSDQTLKIGSKLVLDAKIAVSSSSGSGSVSGSGGSSSGSGSGSISGQQVTFQWLKNGKILEQKNGVKFEKLGELEFRCIVDSMKEEDFGTYTLKVTIGSVTIETSATCKKLCVGIDTDPVCAWPRYNASFCIGESEFAKKMRDVCKKTCGTC